MSTALEEIAAERARQINAEGWTPEHDDEHTDGALAVAAGCYAQRAGGVGVLVQGKPPTWWPWDASWWKPQDPRRNLIKAGALIVAEIERLDRAAQRGADLQKAPSDAD